MSTLQKALSRILLVRIRSTQRLGSFQGQREEVRRLNNGDIYEQNEFFFTKILHICKKSSTFVAANKF